MKDEGNFTITQRICKFSCFSSIFCALLLYKAFTFAYDESAYGSDLSHTTGTHGLLPYLSDDLDLLKNFYISDDEQEERVLRSLEHNFDEYSSTESEQTDSTSYARVTPSAQSTRASDVLTRSIALSNQLLSLPIPQYCRFERQLYLRLPSYEIYVISPHLLDCLKLIDKSLLGRRSQPRHSTTETMISPWVRNFLSRCRRDYLLPIPRDYCADNFNLIFLPPIIERIGKTINASEEFVSENATSSQQQRRYPIFRQTLRLLTHDGPAPRSIPENIERAATALYLLLHQRYVISPRGLDVVRRRFLFGATTLSSIRNAKQIADAPTGGRFNDADPIFGRCPNLRCGGMPLLPIGGSDRFNDFSIPQPAVSSSSLVNAELDIANYRAKRYCALCRQIFFHWDSQVDGCAWGTSFCHLFLMVHGKEVFGDWNSDRSFSDCNRDHSNAITGRIFGFRVHSSAFDL